MSVGIGVTMLVGAEMVATSDGIAWMALTAADFVQTDIGAGRRAHHGRARHKQDGPTVPRAGAACGALGRAGLIRRIRRYVGRTPVECELTKLR